MTDRPGLSRREALKRLTATAVAPAAAHTRSLLRHPLVPGDAQEWQPLVFDAQQTATVTALAETIIPETDTPGAAAALVHQYIDFDLREAPEADRTAFLAGLSRLDQTSRQRHAADFVDLDPSERGAILGEMAAANPDTAERSFFDDAKERTAAGYYTSRIGLLQELEYRGNAFLQRFEGCMHPEHLEWEPEEGR